MTPSLQLVREQFPQLRERVACLFERDATFRELCEDFEVCTLALAHQDSNEGLRREYAALRLRLETEMLQFLREDAEPPAHRR
jgi:hypothetical protein